ncbi:MAG: DUF305 domain-containing protein [Candidatus Margulisiibacteriota bacterium]|jgi:uncharacterized protein (DUF305 family)
MNKEIIISGTIGLILGVLIAPIFTPMMPWGGRMMTHGSTMGDKEFIEQMIPHHQAAVMMARKLLRSTDKPEMKQLAENIIAAQTKEINQMRKWSRAWYGN